MFAEEAAKNKKQKVLRAAGIHAKIYGLLNDEQKKKYLELTHKKYEKKYEKKSKK